jgi:hypothetical protein
MFTLSTYEGGHQGVGQTERSDRVQVDASASPLRPGVRGSSSFSRGTRGKFLWGISSLTPHSSRSTRAHVTGPDRGP